MHGHARFLFWAVFFGVIGVGCQFSRADWVTEIAGSEPLHWWRFEETEGDALADLGSAGLEGLYFDEYELGQPGLVGLAASFDGFGYVLLEEDNLEGDWTIEGIFSANVEDGAVSQGLIGSLSQSPEDMAIKAEQWNSTEMLGYTIFGEVDISFDYNTPDELTHVAMVGTDDGVSLYVEGEFIGSDPTPTPLSRHVIAAGHESAGSYVDPLTGLIDEIVIFDRALEEDEIIRHYLSISAPANPLAPLDDGTLTDPQERADYVHDVLGTWVGDSDLDGEFNSSDFVAVFTAGEYEDGVPGNSSWVTGDWNGDSEFDSSDFVTAFSDGGFELGPRPAAAAAPEPSALTSLVLALGLLCRRRIRMPRDA